MGFAKGNQLGNRKGRPRQPEIEELRKAIKAVQKDEKCTLLRHFVKRAYENDRVLVALGKKIIPDLSSVDGTIDVGQDMQSFVDWMRGRAKPE